MPAAVRWGMRGLANVGTNILENRRRGPVLRAHREQATIATSTKRCRTVSRVPAPGSVSGEDPSPLPCARLHQSPIRPQAECPRNRAGRVYRPPMRACCRSSRVSGAFAVSSHSVARNASGHPAEPSRIRVEEVGKLRKEESRRRVAESGPSGRRWPENVAVEFRGPSNSSSGSRRRYRANTATRRRARSGVRQTHSLVASTIPSMPRSSTDSVTARLERVKELAADLPALLGSKTPAAHATAEYIRREIDAVLRALRQPKAPTATVTSVGRVGGCAKVHR